jgi:hypothetical protein
MERTVPATQPMRGGTAAIAFSYPITVADDRLTPMFARLPVAKRSGGG